MGTSNAVNGDEINGVVFPLTDSGYATVEAVAEVTVSGAWTVFIPAALTAVQTATATSSAAIQLRADAFAVPQAAVADAPAVSMRLEWHPTAFQDARAAGDAAIRFVYRPTGSVDARALGAAAVLLRLGLLGALESGEAVTTAELAFYRNVAGSTSGVADSQATAHVRVRFYAVPLAAEATYSAAQHREFAVGGVGTATVTTSASLEDYNVFVLADDDYVMLVPEHMNEMRVTL